MALLSPKKAITDECIVCLQLDTMPTRSTTKGGEMPLDNLRPSPPSSPASPFSIPPHHNICYSLTASKASLVVDSDCLILSYDDHATPYVSQFINLSESLLITTCTVLTNYNFLSQLKRQRAVRNRGNDASPTPSKRANRLPVLQELSGEQDYTSTPSFPSCVPSSTSLPRPSPSPCPRDKRRSRYGRDEFTSGKDFVRTVSRDAHSPASIRQKHQSVCLSAFDFIIDITAPTSPVTDSPTPAESSSTTVSTPPRLS